MFFGALLVQRGQDPELLAQSREVLTPAVGAVNTIVLLTSSHRGPHRLPTSAHPTLAHIATATQPAPSDEVVGDARGAYLLGDNVLDTRPGDRAGR